MPSIEKRKISQARYFASNKWKSYIHQWNLEHREHKRNKNYERRYGITLEQYNQMFKEQEGKCYICKEAKEKLDVDHNYTTNKVRKLLCHKCNITVGFIEKCKCLNEILNYIKEAW